MAISIYSLPPNIAAAWRPVIFEVTSDRYDNAARAVSAVSSGTGTFARYATGAHTFKVGDVVTGSTFIGINVAYNVKQTVTVISGAYIETDLLFVATATGAGVITRTNNNFQVRCETYVFDQPKLNITSVTNYGGGMVDLVYGSPHGYTSGVILVEGTTHYNSNYIIQSIPTSTSVRILASYSASETGVSRLATLTGTKRQQAIQIAGSPGFRMNAMKHLQIDLTPSLIDSAPASIQTPTIEAIKPYCIIFTEEFDNAVGLLTSYTQYMTAWQYADRATLQLDLYTDLSSFIIPAAGASPSIRFLTNCPACKFIRVGEEEQLSFLVDASTNPSYKVAVQKYDLGGTAAAVAYLSLVAIVDKRGVIPINSNLFDATNSKVVVWLVDNSLNQKTEKRTFVMDYGKYQNPIRVYFENTLGGFDAFTFTGAFNKTTTFKKTSFKKSLPSTFLVRDRAATDIGGGNILAYEVYSALLSNQELLWLFELLSSVSVFIKNIGDANFTPINILEGAGTSSSGGTQVIYDSETPQQFSIIYLTSKDSLSLSA